MRPSSKVILAIFLVAIAVVVISYFLGKNILKAAVVMKRTKAAEATSSV